MSLVNIGMKVPVSQKKIEKGIEELKKKFKKIEDEFAKLNIGNISQDINNIKQEQTTQNTNITNNTNNIQLVQADVDDVEKRVDTQQQNITNNKNAIDLLNAQIPLINDVNLRQDGEINNIKTKVSDLESKPHFVLSYIALPISGCNPSQINWKKDGDFEFNTIRITLPSQLPNGTPLSRNNVVNLCIFGIEKSINSYSWVNNNQIYIANYGFDGNGDYTTITQKAQIQILYSKNI